MPGGGAVGEDGGRRPSWGGFVRCSMRGVGVSSTSVLIITLNQECLAPVNQGVSIDIDQ